MTTPAEGAAETPALSPAEQASVEVGQRGFTEPVGVNELPAEGPQRPEYVPEKFWKDGKADYEALARSYAELEAKQSAPAETPKAPEGSPPVSPEGKIEKPKEPEAAAPAPLATAMDKARTEWSEGAVSDETVAELEAAGIPKEVFNVYLKGLEAITNQTMGEIHSFTDGQDNYNAMSRWAAEKLSQEELDAYNTALDNPQLRENAVRGLYARYSTARPSEGTLITPAGTPSQAGDVYTDRAQLIADQKDPRYSTDATYRQGVMDKLQRSQRGGFQVVQRPMFEREVFTR
ncbi:capsid assembly protein [Novosphingobium lindaniclasticum]|uniref:Capsid assembly protein n=1 Tax=Novosphingobium lindaniclasticum LE124 TaxID=1096930 RepID=T0HBP0_9SPHN|nr:hypothetical protein [Novosphingobium lindaniclasticum]EQB10417.1 hypothetical protein L284_17140 [Novosphingobium lindaniclasticum LE124]